MAEPSNARKVFIFGATSAIAEHTARLLAARGDAMALVGRDPTRLDSIASDLISRGAARIVTRCADLAAPDDPNILFDDLCEAMGGLDAVLIFHGLLGDQALAERNAALAAQILTINLISPATLSVVAAMRLEHSPSPRPVLISMGSVAGDRGRASNFIYGAAKGGLAILYQGLHHRFRRAGSNIRAVVIKAGFVDTPMTDAFDKGGPLWAKPDDIAAIVVGAMDKGGPIVYAPGFWRWVMLVIRLLPQTIMDRVNL